MLMVMVMVMGDGHDVGIGDDVGLCGVHDSNRPQICQVLEM